jgi:hypothetical protein
MPANMMNALFSEQMHPVIGLGAVANAFAGTVSSQAVNLQDFKKVIFVYHKAVGATGTATLIIEACTTAAGANNTAIPFYWRPYLGTGSSTDLPTSNPALAASTGITTTAGSNQLYVLEAAEGALWNVSSDQDIGTYKYVRLTSTEVVASAVLGGILIFLGAPQYAGTLNPPRSVIV